MDVNKRRYKQDKMPNDFLNDEVGKEFLTQTIDNILLSRENQESVNRLYNDVVEGIIKEIDRRIPLRPMNSSKKHVKIRHAFWNNELENKWQTVCKVERVLKRCKIGLLGGI